MADKEQAILNWIGQTYPVYQGTDWRIRSFAWEYDVGSLPGDFVSKVNVLRGEFGSSYEMECDDFKELLMRTEPPEGTIYVTIENKGSDKRIGINVPVDVFQRKQEPLG